MFNCQRAMAVEAPISLSVMTTHDTLIYNQQFIYIYTYFSRVDKVLTSGFPYHGFPSPSYGSPCPIDGSTYSDWWLVKWGA
jgi:hypothetical protein